MRYEAAPPFLIQIGRIGPGVPARYRPEHRRSARDGPFCGIRRRGRPPYSCAEPHEACSDAHPPPSNRAPGCDLKLLRPLLRDAREQGTNLGLTVAAVAAQCPDRCQLPGLGPPRHRFRVDAEHSGDLSRRKQRLGLWSTCRHFDGLSSWTCFSILRLLCSWLLSEPAVDVPYGLLLPYCHHQR